MTCQRAREECAREGAKLGAAEGAEPTACTDSSGPNTYRPRDLRALLYVGRIPRSVGVGVRLRCEGDTFASDVVLFRRRAPRCAGPGSGPAW